MVSEMILSAKCFSTNITRVGSLIRMRTFVNQEIVRLCKLPIAEFANKLFLWSSTASSQSSITPIRW